MTSSITPTFNAAASSIAQKRKTSPPFSLRLSFEERAMLERMAGTQPLGAFIRKRLFGDQARPRSLHQRRPGADREAIGKALGALGGSRLASNMNQIAKAAHMGALPVGPELSDDLKRACADIAAMRQALMQALGKRAP